MVFPAVARGDLHSLKDVVTHLNISSPHSSGNISQPTTLPETVFSPIPPQKDYTILG